MSTFKVFTSTEREEFWASEKEITEFFNSKEYKENIQKEVFHTFDKNVLPYTKTIGSREKDCYVFDFTANGKTVTLKVKDTQNENIVIGKAVAKCFGIK
jgi:hypothetical protein